MLSDLPTSPPHPPPKVPPARKLLSTYKSGRNMPRGPPAAKFCYKTTPLLLIAYPIEYRFLPLLRCVCSCHHEHLTPDGCLSLCRQDFEPHTAAKSVEYDSTHIWKISISIWAIWYITSRIRNGNEILKAQCKTVIKHIIWQNKPGCPQK